MKIAKKSSAFALSLLSLVILSGCEVIVTPSMPEITPLYTLTIADVSLLLGDSHRIEGVFTPVDYIPLVEYELVEATPSDVISINEGVIFAHDVGTATVKASAKSMEGAEVSFLTSTLFNVNVTYEPRSVSTKTELINLTVCDIPLEVTGADKTTEVDYEVYNALVDHKDDVRPLISAELSQYAYISSAEFIKGSLEDEGVLKIIVTAEDGVSNKEYLVNIKGYFISSWIEIPLVNGDFETGSSAEGWDLVNFKDRYVTSTASSIDLTPIKSPSTRVFTMYDKVTDERKVASLTQPVASSKFKAGDLVELSCVISTSYGTRVKSIKLVAGKQQIEAENMVPNWRAQIIKQQFTLSELDIVDGKVTFGLAFITQDETSTSQGWMYLDDFHLEYLDKIYPEA